MFAQSDSVFSWSHLFFLIRSFVLVINCQITRSVETANANVKSVGTVLFKKPKQSVNQNRVTAAVFSISTKTLSKAKNRDLVFLNFA